MIWVLIWTWAVSFAIHLSSLLTHSRPVGRIDPRYISQDEHTLLISGGEDDPLNQLRT
jgi:hypothetical protein